MKTLDFSEKNLANQQEVVKEEIRVNVQNRPYGLFFWTDVAGKAFDKWENAHDGYGSFDDLDAATVADVESFFDDYYGPNNAVLAIVGDVTAEEVFAKVEKHFGAIPSRARARRGPTSTRGRNTDERTLAQTDALAGRPGHRRRLEDARPRDRKDDVPPRSSATSSLNGEASRLYQGLVKGKELLLGSRAASTGPSASPWRTSGPTLLGLFGLYKPDTTAQGRGRRHQRGDREDRASGASRPPTSRASRRRCVSDFYSELEMPHRPRRRARPRPAPHGRRRLA